MSDAWDPQQYDRFAGERAQAFFDLLALVRRRPAVRVVDLGCGTGRLTRELHRTLAAAETLGLDSSPAMLRESAALREGGLRFAEGRIEDFAARRELDLVFSNAALHWVSGHAQLLARLRDALRPAGQLALQVPANHDQPPSAIAAAIARREPFAGPLEGYAGHRNVLPPVEYARLLAELGFVEQHVRLQVYVHRLPSAADVVEWTRGTTLTGYKQRLPDALYARFEHEYRAALCARLGAQRPCLFPFQRILCWGQLA